MNWIDFTVVCFCGVGFLGSIYLGQTDLANTIAVGLLGYLGGTAKSMLTKE